MSSCSVLVFPVQQPVYQPVRGLAEHGSIFLSYSTTKCRTTRKPGVNVVCRRKEERDLQQKVSCAKNHDIGI
jgi:hypothetical protein